MLFTGDKVISNVMKKIYVLSELFYTHEKFFVLSDIKNGASFIIKYEDIKEHYKKLDK